MPSFKILIISELSTLTHSGSTSCLVHRGRTVDKREQNVSLFSTLLQTVFSVSYLILNINKISDCWRNRSVGTVITRFIMFLENTRGFYDSLFVHGNCCLFISELNKQVNVYLIYVNRFQSLFCTYSQLTTVQYTCHNEFVIGIYRSLRHCL